MFFTCPIIDELEYSLSSVGIYTKNVDIDGNNIQLVCWCNCSEFQILKSDFKIQCTPEEYIKLSAENLGLFVSSFLTNWDYGSSIPTLTLLNISVGLIAKKLDFQVKSFAAKKNNNLDFTHLGVLIIKKKLMQKK